MEQESRGGEVMNKEVIERPWENFYCDVCENRTEHDMCMVYKLGMSYAYCPHIRNCEKFVEVE